MPTLSVEASGFSSTPYTGLNRTHSIKVSKRSCMKFAASIGLPIFSVASRTAGHAVTLATYKKLAIKCAIDFTGGSLTRPSAYTKMEQSEKANISYWIGMVFSALIADELLGISQLIHVGTLKKKRLIRVDPTSRSLADLVGQDSSGNWHVIEAKARQATPSNDDRVKWKTQATTIYTIDKQKPKTQSYALARIGSTYSAELVDPPTSDEQLPVSIDLEENAMINGYYGPIAEWLSEQPLPAEREGESLVMKMAGFDPADNEYIYLGLTETTQQSIKEHTLPERIKSLDLSDTYIGSDGIVIMTTNQPGVL